MGDGYLLEQRQEYDLLRIERRLPRTRGLEACLCVCGLVCLFVSSRSFCAEVERGPTLAFGVRWSLDSTEEAISRKKEGFFTALVLVKLAASSSLSSDSWWGIQLLKSTVDSRLTTCWVKPFRSLFPAQDRLSLPPAFPFPLLAFDLCPTYLQWEIVGAYVKRAC